MILQFRNGCDEMIIWGTISWVICSKSCHNSHCEIIVYPFYIRYMQIARWSPSVQVNILSISSFSVIPLGSVPMKMQFYPAPALPMTPSRWQWTARKLIVETYTRFSTMFLGSPKHSCEWGLSPFQCNVETGIAWRSFLENIELNAIGVAHFTGYQKPGLNSCCSFMLFYFYHAIQFPPLIVAGMTLLLSILCQSQCIHSETLWINASQDEVNPFLGKYRLIIIAFFEIRELMYTKKVLNKA